jgi:hypothetical protein
MRTGRPGRPTPEIQAPVLCGPRSPRRGCCRFAPLGSSCSSPIRLESACPFPVFVPSSVFRPRTSGVAWSSWIVASQTCPTPPGGRLLGVANHPEGAPGARFRGCKPPRGRLRGGCFGFRRARRGPGGGCFGFRRARRAPWGRGLGGSETETTPSPAGSRTGRSPCRRSSAPPRPIPWTSSRWASGSCSRTCWSNAWARTIERGGRMHRGAPRRGFP